MLYILSICSSKQFLNHSVVGDKLMSAGIDNFLNNCWKYHTHLVKGILLTGY